jgi:hypothetical protein
MFQQMLRLTLETGTIKLEQVALDGSKVVDPMGTRIELNEGLDKR